MSVRRPESLGVSPSAFYDGNEAKKYHKSSRIVHIQREITNRAIELLNLAPDRPCYVLDVGCGSGLSGAALEKAGHYWVGCDISPAMLEVAVGQRSLSSSDDSDEEEDRDEVEANEGEEEQLTMSDLSRGIVSTGKKRQRRDDELQKSEEEDEDMDHYHGKYEEDDEDEDDDDKNRNSNLLDISVEPLPSLEEVGDVCQADMGQGLPFRPGTFDGVISISALQWLCYSSSSDQDPKLRLNRFFSSLYSVLKRDAKAILQFYPESAEQAYLIAQAASKVGFAGGILVDYPNSTKAKKYYLCLSFERSYRMPVALGTDTRSQGQSQGLTGVFVAKYDNPFRSSVGNGKKGKKGQVLTGADKLAWIKRKKDKRLRQGKDVKSDSKFSGRKRSRGF